MKKQHLIGKLKVPQAALLSSALTVSLVGCSELPSSFRLQQQLEVFSSVQQVNTKLDILWVVDNSYSMAEEQAKLREGFKSFANRYMQPSWDIRLAVITTDTYLAHPSFQSFRNTRISGTNNYVPYYVNGLTYKGIPGRANSLDSPNPPWANLYQWDSSINRWKTGSGGLTISSMRPNYTANWARLLDVDPITGKGNHDGPPVVLCDELTMAGTTSIFEGSTRCEIRDNIARTSPSANTGIANCVNPGPGESAVSQCVNTIQNDTVHSGKSIISTKGSTEQQLINDFLVNATVGVSGYGYEQSLNSVLQLLADNEAPDSATKFFRKDSLRVIIFVSDEDDISVVYPTDGTQVRPYDRMVSGTPCNKTVDGYSYQMAVCPSPNYTYPQMGAEIPVSVVKDQLDSFFRGLDQNPSMNPNYFVATITALTADSVRESGDQATRNIDLGNLVGNGSMALEINSGDYAPLLDAIGQVIVEKKGTYILKREPTGSEEMLVIIRHADGSSMRLRDTQFSIEGKVLQITDQDLILSLQDSDQVIVDYQPTTLAE